MTADVVDAALAALPGGLRPVEVAGETALAEQLRSRLGDRVAGEGERPRAVLETSGDPEVIQAAMARVEDLGTVVLAGPRPATAATLDLYVDLHVRGLTLIGVAVEQVESGPA